MCSGHWLAARLDTPVSGSFLADAIELRVRDDIVVIENGRERRIPPGEFVNVRVIELEDVAVLYAVTLTIEGGGLLRPHEPDRGLAMSNLPVSLNRLRRNGLIEAARDGNAWRVSWGKRALRIARDAGVDVAAA
jgi:hypothetical protein